MFAKKGCFQRVTACVRAGIEARILLRSQSASAITQSFEKALPQPPLATSEMYKSTTSHCVGHYVHIRQQLDESWHGRYTEDRQLLQDKIVDEFLAMGCSCKRPWLVFTAGPMGAGK